MTAKRAAEVVAPHAVTIAGVALVDVGPADADQVDLADVDPVDPVDPVDQVDQDVDPVDPVVLAINLAKRN